MKWALLCFACLAWSGCDKAKSGGATAGSATTIAAPAAAGSAAGSAETAGEPDEEEGSAAAPKTWNVGDVVQVLRDHKWHEAEIVTAGSAYKVLYTFDDQVEDNVAASRLRAERWAKKSHVEVQVGDAWKRGSVVARHHEGASYSYEIALDDGGDTKTFTAAQVRGVRKPKSAAHAASSSGGGAPAGCPGPSNMMRCGGSCVDTHLDDNNCGRCGDRCSAGKHCDGHGFCRDASGGL